ncbi:hypothetical protein V8C34DRAFT_39677 [Trichoderma compactum]
MFLFSSRAVPYTLLLDIALGGDNITGVAACSKTFTVGYLNINLIELAKASWLVYVPRSLKSDDDDREWHKHGMSLLHDWGHCSITARGEARKLAVPAEDTCILGL